MATGTRDLVGTRVLDRDGGKLGKLEHVYPGHGTGEPAWGVVKTGTIGAKHHIVPLEGHSRHDDGLRIAASTSQVRDAPLFDPREEMSPEVEDRLRRHYGGGADATPRERAGHDGGERDRDVSVDREREPRVARREAIAGARERQREEFGGFNVGAAFFGWLVAMGLGVLLTAILSAAGAAIGLSELSGSEAEQSADTISIVGGVLLIAVLVVAWYAGGYVAGRLSRFDGARQGFGAWAFGLLVTLLLAAAGAIFGSEYNVLEQLQLPRIPVDEGSLASGAAIALAAIVLGTLLAAIFGGKVGERYHKKVDRAGYQR